MFIRRPLIALRNYWQREILWRAHWVQGGKVEKDKFKNILQKFTLCLTYRMGKLE